MTLTKCINNHFYDADKYTCCPHCDADKTLEGEDSAKNKTFAPFEEKASRENFTVDVMRKDDDKAEATVHPIDDENDVKADKEAVTEEEKISLQSAVESAKSSSTEDNKTVAYYDFSSETLPPVGWLVCVKGEYFGTSFNLYEGRNTIGRSLKMNVPLAKDMSVSRDKHAIITYEPKKRKFYAQNGEGNSLTYINDDLLLTPCELKDFDKITVGNSELVLRTFCGESFSWEDYMH